MRCSTTFIKNFIVCSRLPVAYIQLSYLLKLDIRLHLPCWFPTNSYLDDDENAPHINGQWKDERNYTAMNDQYSLSNSYRIIRNDSKQKKYTKTTCDRVAAALFLTLRDDKAGKSYAAIPRCE